jgi:hypothetical protein
MKRILLLATVLLTGCTGAGLSIPADAGTDALPCELQPCEPDDAGRCQRCPQTDDGGR